MEQIEPIRDPRKVVAIKKQLKGQEHPRDYLLFVMGMNATDKESGVTPLVLVETHVGIPICMT